MKISQYFMYSSHLYIHHIINYTTFNFKNLVDDCAKHCEALVYSIV
jgi:hypothetical protein